MTDRLIRITTALAVVAVAVVAAVISYQHAYELVRSHGESGVTARLLPFTVDGLIWAASMVVLDASRRSQPVPRLAAWSLGAGIVATVGANLAHGVGHGPVGALVSAWPALALVGSFELLMMLIRAGRGTRAGERRGRTASPACTTAGARSTAGTAGCARLGADGSRAVRGGPAVSAPSPENSTSTAEGQAHPRPSGMTQRRDLELSHDTSLQTLSSVDPYPLFGAVYSGLDTHRRGCADLACRWFVVPIAREQIRNAANAGVLE